MTARSIGMCCMKTVWFGYDLLQVQQRRPGLFQGCCFWARGRNPQVMNQSSKTKLSLAHCSWTSVLGKNIETVPDKRHDLLISTFSPESPQSCHPACLLQSDQTRFLTVELCKEWWHLFTLGTCWLLIYSCPGTKSWKSLAFQWKHLISFQMEAHNELTHSSLLKAEPLKFASLFFLSLSVVLSVCCF